MERLGRLTENYFVANCNGEFQLRGGRGLSESCGPG